MLLRKILGVLDFEIEIAMDGEEAIEKFQTFHPDLIWMDSRMPKMGGEEATQRIRELPGGKGVVIIALTANASQEDKERFKKVGVDDFLLKPFKINAIYEKIRKYFDVEYIYKEEETQTTQSNRNLDYTYEEMCLEIQKLPADLAQELYNQTLLFNPEDMQEIVAKLKGEYPKLTQMILQSIENLDYGDILKALEANHDCK
jgi:CheY-like chemotaxis protein